MRRAGEPSIAVLGMGNLIYSDDGAGLRALWKLDRDPRLPRQVELVDGSGSGLPLVGRLAGAERLLILDAVYIGAPPGTVVRLGEEDLRGLSGGAHVHELGIPDLISALRLMDRMPREMVFLGIQAESVALGTELSPAVESGLGRLVSESLRILAEWTGEASRRESPAAEA